MFTDLSYLDPQIEVIATSPRREMLMSRLATSGFRPLRGEARARVGTGAACLVDCASTSESDLVRLLVRMESDPVRPLVLLGAPEKMAKPPRSAIKLKDEAGLPGLRARLDLRRRQLLCESERALRIETETALVGAPPNTRSQDSSRRLLYVGSISPGFLPLKRALEACDIEVTAAYTLPTAEAHLRESDFTACLLDLVTSPDLSLAALSRPCGPGHILALAETNARIDPDMFDFLVDADQDSGDIAQDVCTIMKRPVLTTRMVRPRLSEKLYDIATGLYSPAFLRAHLPRQLEASTVDESPFSLLCLRARSGERAQETRTIERMADTVASNLREADLACRYEPRSILISLRATAYADAARIARRLTARLESTARELSCGIDWRAVERRAYHNADTLIQSTVTGQFSRLLAA